MDEFRLPLGKTCTKCGEWKLYEDFNKSSHRADGRYPSCKSCRKRWNKENKAKVAAYKQRWYEENRERVIGRARTWYRANQERRAEWHRCWYLANQEHLIEYQRRYRKEYPNKVIAYKRRWYAANPDKVYAMTQRRRAREHEAEGTHTAVEWRELCEAYDNRCAHCGNAEASLTRDHVIPLSRGGSDYIENIQPLCRSCNSRKGTK